jgi:hypothetical protein
LNPQLYAVIFIYLYLEDEVVDKVPNQSCDSHQILTSMKQNITHDTTNDPRHDFRVPSEYGIRRGSDCLLRAPCLNLGSRRWLTRCPCRMCRGHWRHHLPSSCCLGWWHQHFTTRCRESQSRAKQPVDRFSAPLSHPGGAPSPPWGHPSSPHRP